MRVRCRSALDQRSRALRGKKRRYNAAVHRICVCFLSVMQRECSDFPVNMYLPLSAVIGHANLHAVNKLVRDRAVQRIKMRVLLD